jgi:hypothetical protein
LFTDPESAYLLSKGYSEEQEQKALEMMANDPAVENDKGDA